MDTKEPVKFLIVKNLQYEIGLNDTKKLKILQEKIENHYPIKFQNHK